MMVSMLWCGQCTVISWSWSKMWYSLSNGAAERRPVRKPCRSLSSPAAGKRWIIREPSASLHDLSKASKSWNEISGFFINTETFMTNRSTAYLWPGFETASGATWVWLSRICSKYESSSSLNEPSSFVSFTTLPRSDCWLVYSLIFVRLLKALAYAPKSFTSYRSWIICLASISSSTNIFYSNFISILLMASSVDRQVSWLDAMFHCVTSHW